MKNLLNKLFALLAVAGVLFFASCDEDEEVTVDVTTVVQDTAGSTITSATVGDSITVKVSVNTTDELQSIQIQFADESVLLNEESLGEELTTTQAYYTGYVLQAADTGDLEFTITVTGEEATGNGTATLTVEPAEEPAGDITEYSTVLLAAPLGTKDSETFFSSSDGEAYTLNEVNASAAPNSDMIDFGYYYGQSDNASIASPNSYAIYDLEAENWSTLNATKLMMVSDVDFDAQEDDAAIAALDFSSAGESVTGLSADDIVGFMTAGGLKGIFKVNSITGTDGSDGEISLSIKIQEAEAAPGERMGGSIELR